MDLLASAAAMCVPSLCTAIVRSLSLTPASVREVKVCPQSRDTSTRLPSESCEHNDDNDDGDDDDDNDDDVHNKTMIINMMIIPVKTNIIELRCC